MALPEQYKLKGRSSYKSEAGGLFVVAQHALKLVDQSRRLRFGSLGAVTSIDILRYSGTGTHTEYGAFMNVSLTPELENFVAAKVESGRYNSASEVVREALRLLEEHDSARAAQLAEFNEDLGRRLASLSRGEAVDPAGARARLQRKSEQRRKPGA